MNPFAQQVQRIENNDKVREIVVMKNLIVHNTTIGHHSDASNVITAII